MNRCRKLLCLCLAVLSVSITHAKALTKVKIELKWFHQFQFAGIYAAKEQGFYERAGLDVEIIERDPHTTPLDDVLAHKAEFGVADATLILNRLQGKPVVVLAAIYQHSPLVLISLAEKKILSPLELKDKKVMYQVGVDDAIIISMFNELGMSIDDFSTVANSFKPDALLNDNVDAMSAYLGNQTYYYEQRGIPIRVLNPINYGIDLYGDMIFTSETFFKKNQEVALAFRKASIEGWEYAITHVDKMIDLILRQYSKRKSRDALVHEAEYTKRMMANGMIEVGHINMNRFSRIEQIYKHWYPAVKDRPLDGLVYTEYLTYDRNYVYKLVVYLVLICALIVIGSTLLIWRARHKQLKADLAEQKAMRKLTSYKDLILDELITTRVTRDFQITFASEAFLSALGFEKNAILGKKQYELFAMEPDATIAYIELIRSRVEKEGIWRGELALRSITGGVRYFDCVMDEIFDNQGNFQSYLTVHFDITDKKRIEKQSITDELTGIYNRYKLNDELLNNINIYPKINKPFALLMLDVDHFKHINDNYGHNIGDLVLKTISNILKQSVRVLDMVGRWGGEEFLVICPHSTKEGAMQVAEKIRQAIEEYQFGAIKGVVTVSIGVTLYRKKDPISELLERTDKALYQAKNNGRNRVVFL